MVMEVEFDALCRDRFAYDTPAAWADYYLQMARYIESPDQGVRSSAIERLCMAVMRAEPMRRRAWAKLGDHPAVSATRIAWLLDLVETWHARYPDIGPYFLRKLRFHGDDEPFCSLLRARLSDWLVRPVAGIPEDMIRGTLILLGHDGADWAKAAPRLIAALEDPSDYVRGCAARRLGQEANAETAPSIGALFRLIKAWDIARPGIAGPFWSSAEYGGGEGFDASSWMLDILEQRRGDEPADMPFPGIDFYLHEICSHNLPAIERMLRLGNTDIALEAALETPGVVAGMQPILMRLAESLEEVQARRVWRHLAQYYRVMHPRADGSGHVTHHPEWSAEAEAFAIWVKPGDVSPFEIVLYPRGAGARFDSARAAALVDRALPPDLRGALAPNSVGVDDAISPVRLGDKMIYEYTAGPYVEVAGDPDARLWDRIDIVGRGVEGRWMPCQA